MSVKLSNRGRPGFFLLRPFCIFKFYLCKAGNPSPSAPASLCAEAAGPWYGFGIPPHPQQGRPVPPPNRPGMLFKLKPFPAIRARYAMRASTNRAPAIATSQQ